MDTKQLTRWLATTDKKRLLRWLAIATGLLLMAVMIYTFDYQRPAPSPTSSSAILPTVTRMQDDVGEEIYDLIFTGVTSQPDTFAFDGEWTLALLDRATQSLLTVDLQHKSFAKLPPLPDNKPISALTFDDHDLVAWSDGLYRYQNQQQTWQALTPAITLPAPVQHLAQFGDSFYVVGPDLLYKINFDKHGQYLDHTNWLDEKQSALGSPSSILIDGYIYLALPDGRLLRYARGERTAWSPSTSWSEAAILAGDGDYIFALLPQQAQLLIIDDTGQVVNRIQADWLANARFLWWSAPDESWGTMVGGKIYRLPRPTLPSTSTTDNPDL